uniref:small monomeric GTPase n=1 Tax=Entamoeba invadens TaxID=33085 RepID=S0B5C3_ENTIV|nr:RAC GTPase, putative [Entamoeba invadens]
MSKNNKINKVIKIGLVGDGAVGKTTFLLSYTAQSFLTEYTPTIFDNFCQIESVGNDVFNVSLWDTAGQDEYSTYRAGCYSNCSFDVFLLCFSVVQRSSFKNIKNKWILELKKNAPSVPVIVVGTQTDLRNEKDKEHISKKEGEKMAKELKAKRYVECSSKSYETTHDVVLAAIDDYLDKEKEMVAKIKKQYKKEIEEEEKMMKIMKKELEKQRAQEEKEKKEADKKEEKKDAAPPKEEKKETKEQQQ